MIKTKKTIENKDVKREKEVMSLFGFEILDIKEGKRTSKIIAQIDEETSNYYSKYDLYKRVSKWNILPLWPFLFLTIVSFILVTALLIVYLCNRSNPNMFFYLLGIGVPAAVFLFSAVLYSAFKFKADTHNIQPEEDIEEIKKELEKINENRQ